MKIRVIFYSEYFCSVQFLHVFFPVAVLDRRNVIEAIVEEYFEFLKAGNIDGWFHMQPQTQFIKMRLFH